MYYDDLILIYCANSTACHVRHCASDGQLGPHQTKLCAHDITESPAAGNLFWFSGKTVEVKYRGDVADTVRDILGGLRSACTYVGASRLRELPRRATFVRCCRQVNDVFS